MLYAVLLPIVGKENSPGSGYFQKSKKSILESHIFRLFNLVDRAYDQQSKFQMINDRLLIATTLCDCMVNIEKDENIAYDEYMQDMMNRLYTKKKFIL